jgi:glucokinase
MARGSAQELVLAGDIGGTQARLRLYDRAGKKIVDETTMKSGGARSLEALLGHYVARKRERILAAVFGIAGPVKEEMAYTTNLPWVVDERKLSKALDIPVVQLVNYMAAIAVDYTQVGKSAKLVLPAGHPARSGNVSVMAAGTGLGEALLLRDGDRFIPCPSEGGHADFAPSSEFEMALLSFLRSRLPASAGGHVSYERVVSGPGIGALYDFLISSIGVPESKAITRQLASAAGDRNAVISALGLSRKSIVAAHALDLFAAAYGSEAGNLVLKGLSLGGLYLTGNIASRIIPQRRNIFLHAMQNKGRMKRLLARVPVSIVRDERVGLAGAGYLAARLVAM